MSRQSHLRVVRPALYDGSGRVQEPARMSWNVVFIAAMLGCAAFWAAVAALAWWLA